MFPPDFSSFVAIAIFVGIVFFVAAVVINASGKQRLASMEEQYLRLCEEHGFEPTDQPLGLTDRSLASLGLLPEGDREFSSVWGVQTPSTIELDGKPVSVESAAFEWWWEERQTHRDPNGNTTTTWLRQSAMVALVRLPGWNMTRISCQPSGWFARMRISGRRDFRTESAEFNRRYQVQVSDPQLAIRLFEPDMQVALLERFAGSSFELDGELAAIRFATPGSKWRGSNEATRGSETVFGIFRVGGDRVRTDPAIVAALPSVRRQGLDILAAMPASWWRAIRGGSW